MKNIILSLIVLGFTAMSGAQSVDDQINKACAPDAATAGCAGKKMGKGLMKCLIDYGKKNKSFRLSEACETAFSKKTSPKKK